MFIKYIILTLLGFSFFIPFTVQAKSNDSAVTGLWVAKKRDVAVQVDICGEELCGHIAWLSASEDPYSVSGLPLCQAQVLKDFHAGDNNATSWRGGKVYKADEEKTYNGALKLVDSDTLELHAYLGVPVLGKTKTWTRASIKDYPPCHTPAKADKQDLHNIEPASGNQ